MALVHTWNCTTLGSKQVRCVIFLCCNLYQAFMCHLNNQHFGTKVLNLLTTYGGVLWKKLLSVFL